MEVCEQTFTAHIYNKTKKNDDVPEICEAEFDITDVDKEERHLIKPGMIFYWSLCKQITKGGQLSNSDKILFRRIPSWKKFDINATSPETDAFYNFFNNKGADPDLTCK